MVGSYQIHLFVVFFLVKGKAALVLPRFNNAHFAEVEEGEHFGH